MIALTATPTQRDRLRRSLAAVVIGLDAWFVLVPAGLLQRDASALLAAMALIGLVLSARSASLAWFRGGLLLSALSVLGGVGVVAAGSVGAEDRVGLFANGALWLLLAAFGFQWERPSRTHAVAAAGAELPRCARVLVKEVDWQLSCPTSPTHRHGSLMYCALHAPKGAGRLPQRALAERLAGAISRLVSLAELTALATVFVVVVLVFGAVLADNSASSAFGDWSRQLAKDNGLVRLWRDVETLRAPSRAPPFQPDADDAEALAYANELRSRIGLPPFEPHRALEQAARSHASFYGLNARDPRLAGLGAHDEFSGLPGFTGHTPTDRCRAAGAAFGCGEVISFDGSPRAAIDAWMATTYHRAPFLENSRFAGYGRATNGPAIDVMVFGGPESAGLNLKAIARKFVVWPFDGMKNVPTRFPGEIPDPVPTSADRRNGIGYPITVHGPANPTFVSFVLLDEARVAVPTVRGVDPSLRNWQQLPLGTLRNGVTYQVQATISNGSERIVMTWSFTTAARGE